MLSPPTGEVIIAEIAGLEVALRAKSEAAATSAA